MKKTVENSEQWDVCNRCGGAGWYKKPVTFDYPDFARLFPCECTLSQQEQQAAQQAQFRKQELLAHLDEELGNLVHCHLGTFDVQRPLQAYDGRDEAAQRAMLEDVFIRVMEYTERLDGWLYLYGGYGSGKSHLAAAIAHIGIERGMSVSYASVPQLIRFINSGFADRSADARMEALQTVGMLVLDDIGTQPNTEHNNTTLFELINARYLYQRITILTSNKAVTAHEGRIASRIYGRAYIIELNVDDYRKYQTPGGLQ
ncbi:MAG: AAA family ATPase [Chloroflexi bacterium AL-W]|nr:AAA family ATPase [Chloroflexi bacterium AL-N1]NOK70162.1 AAA family ATPase [Chloroflexi bacterium AL-N10]NOK77699.1 AAA family ATPase [Chloroflexi bacterium AL-N5]NOK84708.1 AAA family ATPase [Chloroflexi bacterium AL-W]NOK93229.1 AAA family ATPase [Chloroflexi bacterium AL-N15]